MKLVMFFSSVSGNRTIIQNQKRMEDVLQIYGLTYCKKDICTDEHAKNFVKSLNAQAPVIATLTADNKIGKNLTFAQFEEIVEEKKLLEFFQDNV